MSAQAEVSNVTFTTIPDNRRIKALPHFFREKMMHVEPTVFGLMDEFCEGYRGAYWEFYQLSNGGFFMAPATLKAFRLVNPLNFSDVTLSAEAAGIAICIMAYSHLSFSHPSHVFDSHYTWLRELALDHPEAGPIFRFLD